MPSPATRQRWQPWSRAGSSGGASSLLVAPAAGLTLADKQALGARLLASGADIGALNLVRKHCSRVKGGGLARHAVRAAGLWTLVLSDVVGDDPATIASGPTVADPSTFRDVAAVLARYLAAEDVPAAVRARIERGCTGALPETVKPGDPALARAATVVIGGNQDALAAAAAAARAHGYAAEVAAEPLGGDAAEAGRVLAARLGAARGGPFALVAGGETTVRVRPGGRGGRAQQLALAAAVELEGAPRSEEHTSELQSHSDLVCRLLLEKKKKKKKNHSKTKRTQTQHSHTETT